MSSSITRTVGSLSSAAVPNIALVSHFAPAATKPSAPTDRGALRLPDEAFIRSPQLRAAIPAPSATRAGAIHLQGRPVHLAPSGQSGEPRGHSRPVDASARG